jgi:hypothetical protein
MEDGSIIWSMKEDGAVAQLESDFRPEVRAPTEARDRS